jgi:GNAT superfamily N-acetyltransferase
MKSIERLILDLTDAPHANARKTIDDGLSSFNLASGGHSSNRELAILVSEPTDGQIVGGLLGRTSRGVFYIDKFYLPKDLRGKGLGSRVLASAEQEASARGCKDAVLNTLSFQAPEFYARYGWREFGRIDCDPQDQAESS